MAWQKVNPRRDPDYWVYSVHQGFNPDTGECGVFCTCGWSMVTDGLPWYASCEPSRIHLETVHPGNCTLASARLAARSLDYLSVI